MSVEVPHSTISYPFSLNREGFIKWFRANFYNLKNDPQVNSHIRLYFQTLTDKEKEDDFIIQTVKSLDKYGDREKVYQKYKLQVKEKTDNLEKMNQLLKSMMGYFIVSVERDVDKSEQACKTVTANHVKAIKRAYETLKNNINQSNTVDNSKHFDSFMTELTTVLDEKWVSRFFTNYKKWTVENLHKILETHGKGNLAEDIKLYYDIFKAKKGQSKSQENIFKKPESLPVKAKKINLNSSNAVNKPSEIVEAPKNEPSDSSQLANQNGTITKSEKDLINNKESNKKFEETDKIDPKINKQQKMGKRSTEKVLEPSSCDGNSPAADQNSQRVKPTIKPSNVFNIDDLDLQELQKIKPVAESTKINKPIKSSEIDDLALNIKDFMKLAPIAESTKKNRVEKPISDPMKTDLRTFVLNINMEDLKNLKPVAESTKKAKENIALMKKEMDQSVSFDAFQKYKPIAESTKKTPMPRRQVQESDPKLQYLEKTINPADFLQAKPVAESTTKLSKINNYSEQKLLINYGIQQTKSSNSNQDRSSKKSFNENEKENSLGSKVNVNKSNQLNNSPLEDVKNVMVDMKLSSEENFNKTQFNISEVEGNLNESLKVCPFSPWNADIRTQWWRKMLLELKNSVEVLISDDQNLRSKVTFRTGDRYDDFHFNRCITKMHNKSVDIYVTERVGNNDPFVIKIINSNECHEYYIVKHVLKAFNDNPSNIIDLSLSICSVHNLLVTPSKAAILMSYYKKGNLLNLSVILKKGNFPMATVELITAYIAIELLMTIFYLHRTANVLHCDIKPDNIMLNKDFPTLTTDFQLTKATVITLIDFGRAIILDDCRPYLTFTTRGSPKGLECVEMAANKPWCYQIDLFNIATTLYVLLQNRYPTVSQKDGRYVFNNYTNFRNLRIGTTWVQLFDELINVNTTDYPKIKTYLKSLAQLISCNIKQYNDTADRVNNILDNL